MSRPAIEREVARVMRGQTREARDRILATAPAHLRERVRMEVERRWKHKQNA